MEPLSWAIRRGWVRPLGSGVLFPPSCGVCVFLLNASALIVSGLFVLRLGPSKGHLWRGQVILLALILALVPGLFWGNAAHAALAAAGGYSGSLWLFVLGFLHLWPWYVLLTEPSFLGYLAFAVTFILPLAWCLTWAIDVVRRQRASGAA